MHPAVVDILRFFEYSHLPPHLQAISKHFHWLAHALAGDQSVAVGDGTEPNVDREYLELGGAELTVALRKLLEAKDAAVRAAV